MKKFIFAVCILLSTKAFANEVIVASVDQRENLIAACPICEGGTVVFETNFAFDFESCDSKEGYFSLKVEEIKTGFPLQVRKVVRIELEDTTDCRGPTEMRRYYLKTTELKQGESYILAQKSWINPR